jgi:MtrB/PioB family decaheme-associated outer membrane protein
MNKHARFALKITAMAAAVTAACNPVWATEDDAVKALTKPQSNIEFGVGYTSNESKRFGQYNGFNQDKGYGLIGGQLIQRDDDTGTWMSLSGSNLGRDTQQLRFEHNRQGDWGYFFEYDETPRFNPYTVNTGLTGIGSSVQRINGAARSNVDLETIRETITLGFSKIMNGGLDFQVRFRNEEKDGARQWGQGGAPINFLTDPINQTTNQLDVVLGYTGDKLQLTGGYYGTLFDNHNAFLSIPNSTVFTQMALPPGSQSHQLHLAGGYSFSATTRANFKAAYTRQTQTDQFFSSPPQLNTRTDLGGKVNTTLLQAGITARPMSKLTLLGNLRYDDRDDQTAIARYVTPGTFTDGDNEPRSIRTTAAKAEASYALPDNLRLIGGIDFEEKRRNTSPVRIVSYRAKTDETTYRAELRRSISETLTGAIGYHYSVRDGTPFITTTDLSGATGSNLIAPIHLADRVRQKMRLTANWQAAEPLSLQFRIDDSHDNYDQRNGSTLGPQSGTARTYAVDAAYALDEKWQASAWVSRDDLNYEQLQRGVANPFVVNIRNVGDAFGLGLRGKPFTWLDVGVDFSQQDITEENRQKAIAGAATDNIPDIATKLTRAKIYANYTIKKNVTLRGTYIFDRYDSNDWTWNRWTYSDGTTVNAAPIQEAHFFGVAVNYKF